MNEELSPYDLTQYLIRQRDELIVENDRLRSALSDISCWDIRAHYGKGSQDYSGPMNYARKALGWYGS